MNDDARTSIGTPAPDASTSEELRAKVDRTRDELGQTVEALAADADAEADVTAQAKEKTAAVKEEAAAKAAQIADRIRVTAGQAARLVKDRAPDPLLEKAGRAAAAARANRTPLLTAGAALTVFLLVRRSRGRSR
nr:hypothetical protein OG409_03035 [Streptomyces sp. NBC_00974]